MYMYMKILMFYLMEYHWCMNIVFKDGFDGVFILNLLLGVYVVFYDGFDNGGILSPFFG